MSKDLVKQYINIARQLPESQLKKLPNNERKRFLKKILSYVKDEGYLDEYEVLMLDKKQQEEYAMNPNRILYNMDIKKLDKDVLRKYLDKRIDVADHGHWTELDEDDIETVGSYYSILDSEYEAMSYEQKERLINKLAYDEDADLNDYKLSITPEKLKAIYFRNISKKTNI